MILQQKFVEALQAKKNEHDKLRKSLRDSWLKDKKRLVGLLFSYIIILNQIYYQCVI